MLNFTLSVISKSAGSSVIADAMYLRHLTVCLLLLCTIPGISQTPDNKLIPVDVMFSSKASTGTLLDLDFHQLPVSITVITSAQIEASGARHLSELLEIYVPGFQYMYNKWNGITWGMRGVAADRNTKFIFLVNGHKMNHESRDGAYSELDLGFLSDLERVEVLRGPAGLLYGSGSIAGVINLVTKKYSTDRIVTESTAETWAMNTYGAAQKIMYSRKLENDASLQIYAGFRWSQGTGIGVPRIYGKPSGLNYSQDPAATVSNGVPASGSSWSTPGNFILSGDYQKKDWRIYTRITHQVTNASPFFMADPWAGTIGQADSNTTGYLDGKPISWQGIYKGVEPYSDNRRQYRVNNVTFQVSRDWKVGRNLFKLNGGTDLVSNQITLQKLPGYSGLPHEEQARFIEAFGEKRFNVRGTYIISKKDEENARWRYQLAFGSEHRLFALGRDMSGRNAVFDNKRHYVIKDVNYINHALFYEGVFYYKRWMLESGVRVDWRNSPQSGFKFLSSSRTVLAYNPDSSWSFRVAYQTSGNYGSADNYERNRNSIDEEGVMYGTAHYEHPWREANSSSTVIQAVDPDTLRLRSEWVRSLELSASYTHPHKRLRATGSFSYNTIHNLFVWDQSIFRVRNANPYDFINGEIELYYSFGPESKWTVGINHVISRVVNTNVAASNDTITGTVYSPAVSYSNGEKLYEPVKVTTNGRDSTRRQVINLISGAITADGRNFLNLASNLSKVYVDFAASKNISFHSDWRIFWGLRGRRDLYRTADNSYQYPYLSLDKALMVKWNASIRYTYRNTTLQFFVYDILSPQSIRKNVHSIRWQQMAISTSQTDLYSVDFRSYAVKVTVAF